MTTLHLGDCLNGCATCAENYHSDFAGQTCDTCNTFIDDDLPCCGACGQFFPKNEAEKDGFHSADYCEEAQFSCGACGYQFAKNEGVTIQEGAYLEFVCTPCYFQGEERK